MSDQRDLNVTLENMQRVADAAGRASEALAVWVARMAEVSRRLSAWRAANVEQGVSE